MTTAVLAGCKNTPIQNIKMMEYTGINASKALKNDTAYFFLHRKMFHYRKMNDKTFIDTISGYIKVNNNDMIIFMQNGKRLPKGAKQIGKQQSNGTFNYVF